MKTRLPKMLLVALLAAMAHSHADITSIGEDRYYSGTQVITSVDQFGTGNYAGKSSTVNIGWGEGNDAKDADVTLSGNNHYTTPNALFIGGRGWNRSDDNVAARGELTLTDGAVVSTASQFTASDPDRGYADHVTMGNCIGANSTLNVLNGTVKSGALEASIGGGEAVINVAQAGKIEVGALMMGTNNASGKGEAHLNIDGGSVNVAGDTAIGYQVQGNKKLGGVADVAINSGSLSTRTLTIGANQDEHGAGSKGIVKVQGGTLTVNGGDANIGINGGEGSLIVTGGKVDLGVGDVYLGDSNNGEDGTKALLQVDKGTLVHTGYMYVGDIDGNAKSALVLGAASTATLGCVEVSRDALIDLSGQVTAGTINLYDRARLAGKPNQAGGKVDINIIHEVDGDVDYPPYIVITKDDYTGTKGFSLTSGTTVHAPLNTHLEVEEGATLEFGQGTMHLQDGILYIDSHNDASGSITLASGSSVGYISLKDNANLHGWVSQLSAQNPEDRVALIDTSNFQDGSGYSYGVFTSSQSGQLVARDLSALYVIKFTDTAVSTLNGDGDFKGFYLELADRYPADDAYDDLDRNEQVAYDTIKELDKDIENLPPDLQEIVHEVLNTPGDTQANELAKVLDALNGSTMAVMMHNQIEGNLAQQRRLRSRAYNGRNLRHDKGCTDIYAEAFYDNQHVDYRRSAGMGHNRNEWGGLIGGDTCIGKNWRVGADFAMSWSHVNPTGGMKFKQNSMYMDVYATMHKGNWRSITGIGLGLHNFDVKRGMNGNVWAKADDVKGTAINITEEVAYDYHYNDKTVLQPYVAIDMNINRIDEFTDTGLGSANLHCRRQSAFATDITIGGRYIHDFSLVRNAPDATWTAQLGVTVSVGDTTADLDLNFVGAPDKRFIITTPKRDVVGLNVGTGLTVPVSEHTAIYGGVQAIIRGDSHSFDANLGVRYAF